MSDQPFVSYSQNAEDVVLRRAFRHLAKGRYVDVGANNPTEDSISRSFYDLGWRGITIEPLPELAEQHRSQRPGDLMVEAVIGENDGGTMVLHTYDDSGLSTTIDGVRDQHAGSGRVATDLTVDSRRLDSVFTEAGWQDADIHFMTVDTEGAEAAVLGSFDLLRWRPWVLVIEATLPNSTERSHQHWEALVLAAGYEFCMFDGLSRFYVAKEHAAELREFLDHPACVLDNYITWHTAADRAQIAAVEGKIATLEARIATLETRIAALDVGHRQAVDDAVRWRTASLTRWADSLSVSLELAELRETGLLARQATTELVQLREDNDALAREAAANGLEVANMRRTVSWRVTAPIRKVRTYTRSGS